MNHVERFRAAMKFEPVDRLPRWEWATWWIIKSRRVSPWSSNRVYPRSLDEYTRQ